jgi:hypothetical protein
MQVDPRADVGACKGRGIFNVIVTRHMLAHDRDLVAFVLGKKVGRRQAGNTSTLTMLVICLSKYIEPGDSPNDNDSIGHFNDYYQVRMLLG